MHSVKSTATFVPSTYLKIIPQIAGQVELTGRDAIYDAASNLRAIPQPQSGSAPLGSSAHQCF